jgi:hypothetical protein
MKKWESADIISIDFQKTEDMATFGLIEFFFRIISQFGGCVPIPPCDPRPCPGQDSPS